MTTGHITLPRFGSTASGSFTHRGAVDAPTGFVHREEMRRGPSRRGWALGLPGVALATAGGVWVQARRVAHAPLPRFDDLDPSGSYGTTDPTVHSAHSVPLQIVALGDSSVTGPGLAHRSETWLARIAASQSHPVELVSVARGGSRTHDVLESQLPVALTHRPDLFVVSVGANDAMHGTPSIVVRHQMLTLLSALGAVAPVVSLGIGDLSVIPRLPRSLRPLVSLRSAAIDRAHRSATRNLTGITRVPVSELSDHHFRAAGEHLFSADMFHPNAQGHALWSGLFGPFVAAALAGAAAEVVSIADIPAPCGA